MSGASCTRGKLIVSGILFWYPLAGVTYQFLHYLIGLRSLGWDVYYVEDSGRWPYDPCRRTVTDDPSANIAHVAPTLDAHGFADKWAYRGSDRRCYGMSEVGLRELFRDAQVLLNVTGAQELRDEHGTIPRRIYVESDPFAAQVRLFHGDPGLRALLDAHDTWFSFGENLGCDDCLVPLDRPWMPTRQPIAVELWSSELAAGPDYNTITTWHNEGNSVVFKGETYYWTKDREFARYLSLPDLRPQLRFELASDADADAAALLLGRGFRVREALGVSSSPKAYRDYIRNARAEFTVARDQYVRPNTGWFSDRSASYLAAGRPVITQDTGFARTLPTGRGLFAFRDLDDVLAAIDAVETDYVAHSRAALEIAHAYFAADKVLASLLERAGL